MSVPYRGISWLACYNLYLFHGQLKKSTVLLYGEHLNLIPNQLQCAIKKTRVERLDYTYTFGEYLPLVSKLVPN